MTRFIFRYVKINFQEGFNLISYMFREKSEWEHSEKNTYPVFRLKPDNESIKKLQLFQVL
jgi:hypothetical protein